MCEAGDDLGGDVGLDSRPWFGSGWGGGGEKRCEVAWLNRRKDGEGGERGVVRNDFKTEAVSNASSRVSERWPTLFNCSMCRLAELVGVHACSSRLRWE